ncbi:MAG: hypothetical protein LAT64_02345 [Phycisphaerales bacterium]|nr:hypothetical protein [Planctomycetota bacterium]MCH8507598.1 hypothetical protein [Phycisphaerales bacterium]
MSRVGQLIYRALRAYHADEWDDVIAQLGPCIETAALHDYGYSRRKGFRDFVNDNLRIASRCFSPGMENLTISFKAKDIFSEQAYEELLKAHVLPQTISRSENLSDLKLETVKYLEIDLSSEADRRFKEGYVHVPIGHVFYHCLRCEFAHNADSAKTVVFTREKKIDAQGPVLILPIEMLYGYIVAVVASPAFEFETHEFDELINWQEKGAVSRLHWLWGKRKDVIEILGLDAPAVSQST